VSLSTPPILATLHQLPMDVLFWSP